MNIVIDTNIFISALIRDGITRDIITNMPYNLIFPEFELYEIKKHKDEIFAKSNLSEKEFNILLLRLLNYVKIAPSDIIAKYQTPAFNIMENIDKDDVLFIATALAFNCSIWSDDKHFKHQNVVKVLTTKEIINLLR